MRALITRPREDARGLAELLGRRGIECVIEPLLTIEPVKDAKIDFTGVQAVLLTSANGARALAAWDAGESAGAWRDLAVFTVGEATASAAREAGCRRGDGADDEYQNERPDQQGYGPTALPITPCTSHPVV
ncbi:MAG: uroporphyrinogen-III synthase [Proteobacteria bacterium]|nr:uroporphyrinogen-III synthase [Pseudomonadota bacterium]